MIVRVGSSKKGAKTVPSMSSCGSAAAPPPQGPSARSCAPSPSTSSHATAQTTAAPTTPASWLLPRASTLTLFRDAALFARLWRAFLLQFMAQMCGATAMKYYLPTLLRALGLERRLALMAGALEMTAKVGLTVVEMWLIDRFGRRACLVSGGLIMGGAMLVSGLR